MWRRHSCRPRPEESGRQQSESLRHVVGGRPRLGCRFATSFSTIMYQIDPRGLRQWG
jgi:hypothetical protein